MTPIARVLLVDDDDDHRLLLASALREEEPDIQIEEARGAEEALRLLAERPFSAVLCDYWLGETTGIDLLRRARQGRIEATFLLVTNHGSEEVARRAFLEGAADYVTKEAVFRNPSDLTRRLRRAVEKRHLTLERRRAEVLLQSFMEYNPYGILIFDPAGRVVRWNQALARMERHSGDLERFRALYSPFSDPQLQENGLAARLELARGGGCVEISPFLWDPRRAGFTGAPRVLQGVAFPIALGEDEGAHLCVMIQDVTAQETARRERDQFGAILASILNSSQAAICFVDSDLQVRFANRYVMEFFGVDPAPFIGRPKFEFAQRVAGATADPDAFLARLRHLYDHPQVEAEDPVEVLAPRRRHLSRHSGPVRGPGNQLVGRIEVYRDDTEAIDRQISLEAENRELDAFASRLAHDLKTPLVSLKGFADLLERQNGHQLDVRGRVYLEKIRASASLLSEMVDGLRELAHAGEKVRCTTTFDPLPVLRMVCDTLSEQARDKGVEVTLPAEIPPLECDRARLFQIFQNLISNGIRYADPAKPERRVRVQVEERDRMVALRVEDNGLGIDMEDQRQLFQPYRRGRNAAGAPGMGLGLAIARRVAQACSGQITVESVPGMGTAFTVMLPRAAGDGDRAPPDLPSHAPEGG
ncbi:MAG: sensor histidine kinase [Deferrisomatales bacterium]